MIFDTHTHCYWDSLLPHIDDIIMRMHQVGVNFALQVGCDIPTSKQAIDLAEKFPDMFFASVGMHPTSAQEEVFSTFSDFEDLIGQHQDSIVAIGECGLDFHYLDHQHPDFRQEQIQRQKDWFLAQWQYAKKYDLPLIIHSRDARDATLDFIQQHNMKRVIMHCFSEDQDFAQELLEFSDEIYFSFSGTLTYKNAKNIHEAAQSIPLNRILVETDAPFLSPQGMRGQVCEPSFVRETLSMLIGLRHESAATIEQQVYQNALRCFRISYL